GPSGPPMPEPVATSEAAVATGAQVPVEVVEKSGESWDAPMVESGAEEMMLDVDSAGPLPAAEVSLSEEPEPVAQAAADGVHQVPDEPISEPISEEEIAETVRSEEISIEEEEPERPPGLSYAGAQREPDVLPPEQV